MKKKKQLPENILSYAFDDFSNYTPRANEMTMAGHEIIVKKKKKEKCPG